MQKITRAITASLISLILISVIWLPASALSQPGAMTFEHVRAFRNLVEAGDMAVIFDVNIPYSSYPTTPASSSILFRIFNGTEVLATSRPYVFANFSNNGYGRITSGFYFSASTAPAWEGAYELNILGLPAYYDPSPTQSYFMNLSDYSSATTTEDSRADFYNFIITIIDSLASVYPTVALKTVFAEVTTLSSYGESYFRGAIPGIQSMCPQLFYVMLYVPQVMTTSYNMTLQTQYTQRLDTVTDTGTSDIKRGATRLGAFFGVSYDFILGIFIYLGCLVLTIALMKRQHGLEVAFFADLLIMIGGALIVGSMLFTLLMIAGVVAAIIFFYSTVLKRA